MPKVTAKVVRRKDSKGGALARMKRVVRTLGKHEVDAGFFKESGIYPSPKNTQNWTYAQLMAFHELQVEFTERRPVLKEASKIAPNMITATTLPAYREALRDAVRGNTLKGASNVLDEAGRGMMLSIGSIFGKAPPLAPNRKSTVYKKGFNLPMIETGALLNEVSYRNTKDKEIKK